MGGRALLRQERACLGRRTVRGRRPEEDRRADQGRSSDGGGESTVRQSRCGGSQASAGSPGAVLEIRGSGDDQRRRWPSRARATAGGPSSARFTSHDRMRWCPAPGFAIAIRMTGILPSRRLRAVAALIAAYAIALQAVFATLAPMQVQADGTVAVYCSGNASAVVPDGSDPAGAGAGPWQIVSACSVALARPERSFFPVQLRPLTRPWCGRSCLRANPRATGWPKVMPATDPRARLR